jgi:RNA polymerase sigma factor (sigma-70 family)
VNSLTDQQLLGGYAERRCEAAFAELVRRHLDLVHSAAVRMVCDAHLAQDVSQGVFVALAQNARQLTNRPVLSGWLHRTAQNLAAKVVRSDARRRAREFEAAAMNQLLSAEPDANWDLIAPHLDAALGELNEPERDAVLLRYFERKSAREMAQVLGTSEDAAQKRVSRALEHLRQSFTKRGLSVGASGLAAVIAANAVEAAPAGLAATISTSAILGGATLATTATATKAIAMTTLQKAIITATIAAAVGTGVYEAHQAATMRGLLQTLQQQQAPLTEQLSQLKTDNELLSNQVAQAEDAQALSQAQLKELLKLRAKSTLAQTDSRELAKLKSTLAQQTGKTPSFIKNAFAAAMQKAMQERERARLSRMKKMLNLTDDQEQAINNIMTNNIQRHSQMGLDLFMGKLTPEQALAEGRAMDDQEAQIKALLTPEQLAAYPEVQQAEKRAAADTSATAAARKIANKFGLPKDHQEQLRALLYAMNLKEPAGAPSQRAIAEARRNGNLAELANMEVELKKVRLEEELKILEGFLSPQQMTAYRKEQTDRIDDAMKMFTPLKAADATND